jgi:hypothetical protein
MINHEHNLQSLKTTNTNDAFTTLHFLGLSIDWLIHSFIVPGGGYEQDRNKTGSILLCYCIDGPLCISVSLLCTWLTMFFLLFVRMSTKSKTRCWLAPQLSKPTQPFIFVSNTTHTHRNDRNWKIKNSYDIQHENAHDKSMIWKTKKRKMEEWAQHGSQVSSGGRSKNMCRTVSRMSTIGKTDSGCHSNHRLDQNYDPLSQFL